MAKNRIIVGIVIIGIVILTTGIIISIKDFEGNSKEKIEEINKTDEALKEDNRTIEYIIAGIKYKNYSIIEKKGTQYFKINISNTTNKVSQEQTIVFIILDINDNIIDTAQYTLPKIKPNASMNYEFKYEGKSIPKQYKIDLNVNTNLEAACG